MIRPVSSTRVSRETYAARSTSTKERKLTSPPSRRSFAKRSPSTVLATRVLSRRHPASRPGAPNQPVTLTAGRRLPPQLPKVQAGHDQPPFGRSPVDELLRG